MQASRTAPISAIPVRSSSPKPERRDWTTSSGKPGQAPRSRPRLIAPGVGRRPVLTLADRLLATILHQGLSLPQAAIAALLSVRPETINKRIRAIRQLLDQAGRAIQPGPHLLASLDDLYSLATAEGITVPPEIKAGR